MARYKHFSRRRGGDRGEERLSPPHSRLKDGQRSSPRLDDRGAALWPLGIKGFCTSLVWNRGDDFPLIVALKKSGTACGMIAQIARS